MTQKQQQIWAMECMRLIPEDAGRLRKYLMRNLIALQVKLKYDE